ncbi:PAS domain-containing protein [Azospirillum sp. RWY-5-1]|uniref:histidine kinase n=1 Tax=Azospirillum oleiclasticum TaxID=2735135 RepID=A0ABX2T983_9PROT|nr:PAS domain-containing protein [Azospirillum oleiclasticum]NYZ12661.1 PAS domain-containing protein [Azospirillum oleiclasticum]NYZ19821.1 PAS domain-containing protein [Azospirillum oleiclasticum]
MGLFGRLVVLVAVAVAPAVAIQAMNEIDLRRERQAEIHGVAVRLGRLAASELDRIIDGTRLLLGAVLEGPSVRTMDSARCSAYLADLQARFPQYLRLGVFRADGTAICASRPVPPGFDITAQAHFQETLQTGEFAIGTYQFAERLNRHALPMALAAHDDAGRVIAVGTAALDLGWLTDQLEKRSLPTGGSLTIADREDTVIARTPFPERFIGSSIPNTFIHLLHAPDIGSLEMQSQDGTRRVLGYVPLTFGPRELYVSAGVSTEHEFEAIDRATQRGVVLIAVGATLALLAAFIGGRLFLMNPILRILTAANRLRDGDSGARTGLTDGTTELGRLGLAFDAMADGLERRSADLREAQGRLLKHERDFSRFLVESSTDGILAYDRDGRVTLWNPAVAAVTGLAEGDALGRHLLDLYPTGRGDDLEAAMAAALSGRPHAIPSAPYHPETGREGTVETQHSPLLDEDGRVIGGIAFLRDTTERERIAARLRETQKLEILGQLTGGVAHDFNNLLTAIIGSVEIAKRNPQDHEKAARFLDNAITASERGARLVQQLLAFARRQHLQAAPTDVGDLLTGMEDLLERSVGPQVSIERIVPADLPPALADPTQLELGILNLAINARDAMPEGGRLTIVAGLVGVANDGDDTGADLPAGDYLCITVTDTGEGIPPALLDRIVEPFFTTKPVGKGSGLGLSQVQGFAKQSGGGMRIESRVGVGTTVHLYLPRATSAVAPARAPVRPRAARNRSSALILLVDDQPEVLAGLAGTLRDAGHRVVEVAGGEEALARIAADGPPDLLLTDQAMPGMSGAELIRRARAEHPALRALCMTGYAEGQDSPTLPDGVRVLHKPFDTATLLAAIDAELGVAVSV